MDQNRLLENTLQSLHTYVPLRIREALSNQLSIHGAAYEGKADIVVRHLNEGVNPDIRDQNRKTPLLIAIQRGQKNIVDLLLEYHADVNLICTAGVAPLHAAILARDARMVDSILEHNPSIEIPTAGGLRALHLAIYVGSEHMVRSLMRKGADVHALVGGTAGTGETVLHMAVASFNEELLPILLERGAEVDAATVRPRGHTALHTAAEYGNLEALDILLERGANIHARYLDGTTALHKAVQAKRFYMVERLLKEGLSALAETNIKTTPLSNAAARGNIKIIEMLWNSCGDVATAVQKAKALISAAGAGHIKAVSYLISRGCSVNQPDERGNVPLTLASYRGQTDVVKFLLSKGATYMIDEAIRKSINQGHTDVLAVLREPERYRAYKHNFPFVVPKEEMMHAIAMDISLQLNRRVLANPLPGGLPAYCTTCQDLNFRRGVRRDAEVIHMVDCLSLALSAARSCEGCRLLCECLERITDAYRNVITPWSRTSDLDLVLYSMGKGAPLLVCWKQHPDLGLISSIAASSRVELYTQPGVPTRFQAIGEARDVQTGVWTTERRLLTLKWLADCTENHDYCPYELSALPTRVIDVGPEGSTPYLYITNKEKEKYIALSHCWGGKSPIITTTQTITARKSGIPLNDFPRTFRDAITITRSLGIRYLWIDSLCIIQDSIDDWEKEAAQMADVYAKSYLMIAADDSENCNGGCFPANSPSHISNSLSTPCSAGGGRPSRVYFRLTNMRDKNQDEVCHRLNDPRSGFMRSPLNKRGWCLQERILAPRTLHCGTSELAWECACRIACECQVHETDVDKEFRFKERFLNPYQGKDADLSAPSSQNTWLWVNVVEEFTRRNLTKHADTLPALSGLARRMCSSAESEYVCGLWRRSLLQYLTWEPDYDRASDVTNMSEERLSRRNHAHTVPSWSWASIIGPIKFSARPQIIGPNGKVQFKLSRGEVHWNEQDISGKTRKLCAVEDMQCVTAERNPFGPPVSTSLKLRGDVARVRLIEDVRTGIYPPRKLVVEIGHGVVEVRTISYQADVHDDFIETKRGDALLLLFFNETERSDEGISGGTASVCGGNGLVLKRGQSDGGEETKYMRVGTFTYEGKDDWEGWRRLRKEDLVSLV